MNKKSLIVALFPILFALPAHAQGSDWLCFKAHDFVGTVSLADDEHRPQIDLLNDPFFLCGTHNKAFIDVSNTGEVLRLKKLGDYTFHAMLRTDAGQEQSHTVQLVSTQSRVHYQVATITPHEVVFGGDGVSSYVGKLSQVDEETTQELLKRSLTGTKNSKSIRAY